MGMFPTLDLPENNLLTMIQLYPAEINPIKTRAKANAVSTCSNWLFNFLVVMITPIMISKIGRSPKSPGCLHVC